MYWLQEQNKRYNWMLAKSHRKCEDTRNRWNCEKLWLRFLMWPVQNDPHWKKFYFYYYFFFTPLRRWRKPPRFSHVNNIFWWAAILPPCHQNSHVENLTHSHSHKRANTIQTRECVCQKCPQVGDFSIPGAIIMSQRKPRFPLTKIAGFWTIL